MFVRFATPCYGESVSFVESRRLYQTKTLGNGLESGHIRAGVVWCPNNVGSTPAVFLLRSD